MFLVNNSNNASLKDLRIIGEECGNIASAVPVHDATNVDDDDVDMNEEDEKKHKEKHNYNDLCMGKTMSMRNLTAKAGGERLNVFF